MSYILDALRRAEAQRERGRLPSLHQAATGGTVLIDSSAGRPRWFLPLVLLLVGGGLIGGLILFREPAAVFAPSAQPVDVAETAASAVAAGDGQSPAIGTERSDEKAVLALPRKAVIVNAEPAVTASPAKPPANTAEPPASAKITSTDALPRRPGTAEIAPQPAPTTRTASAAPTLPSRQQLPQELQRRLPQIVVSGTVFSSDPAQRMLVVNGELWREGDQIRPGLILQEIRRRDAVLRFDGVAFTVSP